MSRLHTCNISQPLDSMLLMPCQRLSACSTGTMVLHLGGGRCTKDRVERLPPGLECMLQARHKPAADQLSGYLCALLDAFLTILLHAVASCNSPNKWAGLLCTHLALWAAAIAICRVWTSYHGGLHGRTQMSYQVSTHFIRSTGSSCAAAVLSIREYTHTSANFWR